MAVHGDLPAFCAPQLPPTVVMPFRESWLHLFYCISSTQSLSDSRDLLGQEWRVLPQRNRRRWCLTQGYNGDGNLWTTSFLSGCFAESSGCAITFWPMGMGEAEETEAGAADSCPASFRDFISHLASASAYCPVCFCALEQHRCKLICKSCGYFMSCSDYY
jgi:hypothetical protein